jgi:hypothetical protein
MGSGMNEGYYGREKVEKKKKKEALTFGYKPEQTKNPLSSLSVSLSMGFWGLQLEESYPQWRDPFA